MDFQTILLISVIVFGAIFVFNWLGQKKMADNTVVMFTGALGSGKSFLAVHKSIVYYKRVMFWRSIIRILFKNYMKDKPLFLSNIPVYIGKSFPIIGKPVWAEKLTWEHIILERRIPEYSVVLIDELGQFASQYDFDNAFVMSNIQEFMRFFRHYIDGRLYITDQSSSNIVVPIRRRINQIYNLSDFKRFFIFFYKVNVQEVHIMEDLINVNETNSGEQYDYFFGFLPLKLFYTLKLLTKHYDSRCYSINYKAPVSFNLEKWLTYKTDYFIELPNQLEMKKEFKSKGYLPKDRMLYYLDQWKNRHKIETADEKAITGVPSSNTKA
jgi:hypothetical protein